MHLLLTDIRHFDLTAIKLGDLEEEIPVLALRLAQRRLRHHVDGLQARLALVFRGTDIDADAASSTVLRRNLDGVLETGPVLVLRVGRLESRGRTGKLFRVVNLDAEHGVWAYIRALAALDAGFGIPRRNLERDVALFPFCRASGEGAVDREGAHRDFIAVAGVDYAEHIALELGGPGSEGSRHFGVARDFIGNGDFEQVGQGFIHGAQVLLHDLVALFTVRVADRFTNGLNGLVTRQHFGDRKEARLQNGVHARAHAGVASNLISVNDEESSFLGDQLGLDFARQVVPDFVFVERTIEQEDAAGNQGAEHVVAFEEDPLVAGDEVGFGN